jgi:hypothetical protein
VLKAIWHRPVQAVVIAMLSALVTACAVLTPLYQRALEQASVATELDHAPASSRQLELVSTGVLPDLYSDSDAAIPPLSADQLVGLVPAALRQWFLTPIPAVTLVAATGAGVPVHAEGRLLARAGACDHLRVVAGTCPTAAGQLAVSTADAKNFGWQPGSRVPAIEVLPKGTPGAAAQETFTVSGVYEPSRDGFWDGWALTGVSGTQPDRQLVAHDAWVADETALAGDATWRNPVQIVDLPLDRGAVGIDELLRIGPETTRFQHVQAARPSNDASIQVRSQLDSLAAAVRTGRGQARVTVPLLMVPLGILGLVVLSMALGAAADERRPEVAVARLRGRGVAGARAYLLRELLAVVLAGVPVGLVGALGLGWIARHWVLPGDVGFELRPPVWWALGLSVAAVSVTTVVISARVSREPIAALLRRVPRRRTGWTLGTADAVALTLAAAIVVAFATGRLTGPVARAAPGVVTLALGLLLARGVPPLATSAGRRLLARGRTGSGVALLQLARRSGTRGIIVLLTVSAGILVFAGDAVAVGARNRSLAAEQQVGAPMVATLTGGTVSAVEDAIGSLGPRAADVTPVVVQRSAGQDDQTNLYVEPRAFRRIAVLPGPASVRSALARIGGPGATPITVIGRHLTLQVSTTALVGSGEPVQLGMRLLGPDRATRTVTLGQLPTGDTPVRTLRAPVHCDAGCVLTGWVVSTSPANDVTGTVTVGAVRVDRGAAVPLGNASDWSVADSSAGGTLQAATASVPDSLAIQVANEGHSTVVLQHRWVPTVLPAVVSGSLPDGAAGSHFAGTGLDGNDVAMVAASRIPWIPSAGRDATISDLDLAGRAGAPLGPDAELQVWFAHADDALLSRLTKALRSRDVSVGSVARESEARDALGESPAAWSLRLGILVGVSCLLVAGLGLTIAAAATWRTRTRDLAVLGVNGTSAGTLGRISLGEQLPPVVLAVLAGAAGGVLAAHYALPSLPLLPTEPAVDLLDLSVPWGTVMVLSGAALIALGLLAWLLGLLISRRATLGRVLEPT